MRTGMFVEEETLDEDGPLDGESGEEKVEAKSRPWVTFEESHKKAKTDNDHDVDVLEPWNNMMFIDWQLYGFKLCQVINNRFYYYQY